MACILDFEIGKQEVGMIQSDRELQFRINSFLTRKFKLYDLPDVDSDQKL